MPVAASWHQDLSVPARDPFTQPARIEDVGVPIRLAAEGREAELRRELVASLELEGRLDDAGHSCQIKGTDGCSCHSCPLHDAADPLCEVGRKQERICTELKVIVVGGRRK